MKLWKCLVMAASLGLSAPQSANSDVGLVHVSPSLAMAEPCGDGDGCSFTWTLATRFGDALAFAEQRYGQRDLSWTLLGVDFARVPLPQIFYVRHNSGRKAIVVHLTAEAATDEKHALFQLAHEVVHTLSPIGPHVPASVLEEGVATYNSIEYVKAAGFQIEPSYIGPEAYQDAYWTMVELEEAHPDFQERTAALRKRHGSLSSLTTRKIRNAYPSISLSLAQRLARDFEVEH